MPKLDIIVASTRPGRVGLGIANWFYAVARAQGAFELELVDLLAWNLPMFDEPRHPRLREYEHEHTRAWSAAIGSADAFVFVTPEYNHGAPPALVNALTYLAHEWAYKPASFVSYGGVSGGTRSAEMSKLMLSSLRMVPLYEAVNIPFVHTQMKGDEYPGSPQQEQAALSMLGELSRWATALRGLRAA